MLIDVGGVLAQHLRVCTSAEIVGRFHAEWVMPYEDDLPIVLCRGLRVPVQELWPRVKHFE